MDKGKSFHAKEPNIVDGRDRQRPNWLVLL